MTYMFPERDHCILSISLREYLIRNNIEKFKFAYRFLLLLLYSQLCRHWSNKTKQNLMYQFMHELTSSECETKTLPNFESTWDTSGM